MCVPEVSRMYKFIQSDFKYFGKSRQIESNIYENIFGIAHEFIQFLVKFQSQFDQRRNNLKNF